MSTAPTAAAARQDKFTAEKAVIGGITVVTMSGTINDEFEGKKVGESIKTKKVIVNMRDVRRLASWGMSEWMDFLRVNAEHDLYLVECSTYAVSQINLVTGLLGHAKLVSFYASYRCGSCSEELVTLFLIPRDRAIIRDLPGSQQDCPTCGGRARLEEYPAAFFETIAQRLPFDIDDEALRFMRSNLRYDLAPDLTRFRAYRRVQKDYTYLRLTGNISTLPPDLLVKASEGTTVVDLEGIVFEPNQVNGWRSYVQTAMSKGTALQLVGCPPGFPEAAIRTEDLHDKLKVRTFALSYVCGTCDTTTLHMVDVAVNLEQLVGGTAPSVRCSSCRSTLVAALNREQVAFLKALPARDRDLALDTFLTKSRAEPAEKLENCLVAQPLKRPAEPVATRSPMLLVVLSMLVIGGLGVIGFELWQQQQHTETTAVVNNPNPVVTPPRPTFVRPDWIMSDVPSSAYCHDMINRLMCVGVSSYRATRDDAVAEASDAALEELVSSVGLKISDPFFRENVIPAYSDLRAKALSALEAADLDRANDPKAAAAYAAADDAIGKVRKRVVSALQASGGAAVPTQRSDWYWEEYAKQSGKGTEVLVFVRFDVTLDAVRALVDKYSSTTVVMGTSVMTAFPALAWEQPDFTGGAVVTKASRPLGAAGITPHSIVTAVNDQKLTDATTFARRFEEGIQAAGSVKLTVKTGDAPERVLAVKR